MNSLFEVLFSLVIITASLIPFTNILFNIVSTNNIIDNKYTDYLEIKNIIEILKSKNIEYMKNLYGIHVFSNFKDIYNFIDEECVSNKNIKLLLSIREINKDNGYIILEIKLNGYMDLYIDIYEESSDYE